MTTKELNDIPIKELLGTIYRYREDEETKDEYIFNILGAIKRIILFVPFHQDINKIIKKQVDNKTYQYTCSRIKGYENAWLKALKEYIIINYDKLNGKLQ